MKARISYNVEGHMDWILLTDNDLEIDYWYSAQDIANLLTLHIENGKDKRKTRMRKPLKTDPSQWANRTRTYNVNKTKPKVASKVRKDWLWKSKNTTKVLKGDNRKRNK